MTTHELGFTLEDVLSQADARTYERGLQYHQQGCVTALRQTGSQLCARVIGTRHYSVTLDTELDADNELRYSCDCPVGEDERLCKHVVAVALAGLESYPFGQGSAPDDGEPDALSAELERYLAQAPAQELRRWLRIALKADTGMLQTRIFVALLPGPARLSRVRDHCRNVFGISEYLGWNQMSSFAQRAAGALELVEDLFVDQVSGVEELVRELIAMLDMSDEYFSDRENYIRVLRARVFELHVKASVGLRDTPKLLVAWLVTQAAAGEPAVQPVLQKYAPALGPVGLALYCASVVRARTQELDDQRKTGRYYGNSPLQRELERCVAWEHPGDVPKMVAAMSWEADPSTQSRLLDWLVSRETAEASEEALRQARAIAKSSCVSNPGLADQVAAIFRNNNCVDELEAFCRVQFVASPGSQLYFWVQRQLTDESRKETLALECIEQMQRVANPRTAAYRHGVEEALLRVYLARGQAQPAWDLFRKGRISDRYGLEVARLIGPAYPEEASLLCLELLPKAIARSNTKYEEPANLVATLAALRKQQGCDERLRAELCEIKSAYKARRNFMQRLRRLGLEI